ncbi:MAG TPA: SGNH/GDSL hydrolase family protein [Thermoanaerobaculia bacterium]|nr:SGNH/GDSL hydrolase family protein [Thermoanaerobaculia bacterium]
MLERSKKTPALRRLLALALVTGCTLLAMEGAYRLWLQGRIAHWDGSLNYKVTPRVYVEFDPRYGERFKPDSELWVSYVVDGRLAWGSVISRSNRDGLGGRTTIDQYRRAPVKVLVFGDSFTHWNQGGVTWPDLLQDHLRRALRRDVAVLDYARGGYGLLQMLDLAADKAAELRPDLVVIAAIGDDFTRKRWWCKEVRKDGITRWLLSERPDHFSDDRIAIDYMVVDPAATREWSQRRLALAAGGGTHGEPDPVLAGANAQFRKLRDEVAAVRRDFHPWTLDRSYLLHRLTHGYPFAVPVRTIPRFDFDDFAADARTRSNLRRLAATGIPLLLVYLPTAPEMAARECLASRRTRRLMSSLEHLAGTRFRLVQREYRGKMPAKMDLLPYDAHPSRQGLQLYADTVTPMALAELARLAAPAACRHAPRRLHCPS